MSLSADAFNESSLGVNVGTLGLEYTKKFNDKLDFKLGVNRLSYSTNGSRSDIDYDAKFKMSSLSILVDCHVFDNNFVLSAGAGGTLTFMRNINYS